MILILRHEGVTCPSSGPAPQRRQQHLLLRNGVASSPRVRAPNKQTSQEKCRHPRSAYAWTSLAERPSGTHALPNSVTACVTPALVTPYIRARCLVMHLHVPPPECCTRVVNVGGGVNVALTTAVSAYLASCGRTGGLHLPRTGCENRPHALPPAGHQPLPSDC